jgi:hypothetical protein
MQSSGDDEKSTDVMLGTLLGLLGLRIAFTYAFALDRHSSRKAAVLLEANALSTAFLRADLLQEPERQWHAPSGWSGLIVSASWASGPLERCFPAQAGDIPVSCAA